MKKITPLKVFIAVCFIVLPSLVYAGGGSIKHCTTPPDGGPTVCVDGFINFTAVTYDTSFAKYVGESQLFVELGYPATGPGYPPGAMEFHFFNTGPYSSTITAIYFGDEIPLFDYDSIVLNPGPGVAFDSPATPGDMPGGIDFPAVVFSADNDPGAANGIDPGEYLNVALSFNDGYGYDDLINALADGSMALGLHVQRIGYRGQQSIKMVSNVECLPGPGGGPTPIPEPATMLLLGTGLAGLAGTARRRSKVRK